MARSPNCTGAPLFKGRVDVSITYPTPDETLLETPVALPTSEPAEAQISYTLASGHMPVWSPYELAHVKTALLYAAGKNTSGSTITVYYRILKNGTDVATGSQDIAAGQFYTWSHYNFFDVSSGDVLSCKLWASASGMNWDYKAVIIFPTRVGPKGQAVAAVANYNKVGWMGSSTVYTFTKGTPYAGAAEAVWYMEVPSWMVRLYWNNVNGAVPLGWGHKDYGLVCIEQGDYPNRKSVCNTSSTYRPYIFGNARIPSRLAYTPLNLRV